MNYVEEKLKTDYGKEIGEFLFEQLQLMVDEVDDSCIDNYRFCNLENSEEVELYKEAQDNGCCGFEDERFTFIDANNNPMHFMIGFNYGH